MSATLYYEAPFGGLLLQSAEGKLARVDFSRDTDDRRHKERDDILTEAARQLEGYFAGALRRFDLPMAPCPYPGLVRYWRALCDVPYGETVSYAELAARSASLSPAHPRAAAQACARNHLAIFVPCHRVIGATGKITGYAGGVAAKEYLLELERRVINS